MATGGRKDAELDKFLRNVDEVDSIIKGLASDESSATEKADEFLQRYQENTQTSNAVVDRWLFKRRFHSTQRTQESAANAVNARTVGKKRSWRSWRNGCLNNYP